MKPHISVVVPLHNEEGNLPFLYQELKEVLEKLDVPYEILFVNDGSTDRTREILMEIFQKDKHVKVVELDGNFGEAAALSAGFAFCKGEVVLTMDGDGQNDPKDLPLLLEELKKGYKAVSGWRKERKENFFKRVLPSKVANWLIALITNCKIHDTGCGLKAYRAELVRGFQIPHGFHRFLPALFGVKGREVSEVVVKDRSRKAGKSHYGLYRILEVIRELLTIRFVLSGPKKWKNRFLKINFILAILTASGILLGSLPLAIGFGGLLLIFYAIYRNLKRFLQVQQRGAYRVKYFWTKEEE
jgi:glycosyltransferase involved in cell wall biosynthesis